MNFPRTIRLSSQRRRLQWFSWACLIWGSLGSLGSTALAQSREIDGRVQIADANVMRGLGGFKIRSVGFLNEARQATSHVKTSTTDEEGNFTVEVTGFGTVLAAFSEDLKVVGWSYVEDPLETIVIPLTRSLTVEGQLVFEESREPLADRMIQAMTPMAPNGNQLRSSFGGYTVTNDTGRFKIDGLLPGVPYHLSVSHRKFDPKNPVGDRYIRFLAINAPQPDNVVLPLIRMASEPRPFARLPFVQPPNEPIDIPWMLGGQRDLAREVDQHTSENRLAVVVVGPRADAAALDRFYGAMSQLQASFADRTPWLFVDQDAPENQKWLQGYQRQGGRFPWLAVMDARGEVVEQFDLGRPASPPLFYASRENWFPDTPPEIREIARVIEAATGSLERQEVEQIEEAFGYGRPNRN